MFKPIKSPTQCPSCSSDLVFKNDILYCLSEDCEAKTAKALEHFAKTIKIKGLGPASISKIEINSLEELYGLTQQDFELALGLKNGCKVFLEIEKTKNLSLNVTLPAFGVPLIGKSATEKLSLTVESIEDITEEACSKAKLGPKATENLLKWIKEVYEPRYREVLPLDFTFEQISNKPTQSKGIVCITGKLKTFKTKAQAEKILTEQGYTCKSTITKDTKYLINEGGEESAKTKKARESGINIVIDIKQLIGEQ